VANPVLPKGRRRPLSNEMLTEMRFGPPAFVGVCVCLLENWRGWL
jgi:hypothetical protein